MDRRLTITVGNEDRTALKARMMAAVGTGTYQGEFMSFATPELLFTRLNDNRYYFKFKATISTDKEV